MGGISDNIIDLLDELLLLEEGVLALVSEDELIAIGKIYLNSSIYHELCLDQLMLPLLVILVHFHYDKMRSILL